MNHQHLQAKDFVSDISHIDTFVDIDESDLVKIYNLATKSHIEKSGSCVQKSMRTIILYNLW